MEIFITGPDGLLGSNLVRELLRRGHHLNVLVQEGRSPSTLDGLPVRQSTGNLLDYESLKRAAGEAEAIFHVAASTSIWPSRQEIVNKVNIEGTAHVLKLAKELKVKRFIHVGTANTFQFGSKESPGREETPYVGEKYGLDYMDSKYKAHLLVLQAIEDGLPGIVVNPTFMLGPYDSTPSSGAMVLAVYKRQMPGYAPGGRNFINVKDAVVGIANALTIGRIGESYIIGNENLSYEEGFRKMAGVLGVPPPRLRFPSWAILAYGGVGSLQARLTGKKPQVSLAMAKIACDGHYFTAAKAVKELALPQRPIEEGIEDCFLWLKNNGYLSP